MLIDDIRVYNESMKIAELIYSEIQKWDSFSKDTIGKQLMRSADSIAANISEGHGRFHYKSNKLFCYYSNTWLTKAKNRKILSEDKYIEYKQDLRDLSVKLNNYIKSIGNKREN